jgi:hypothetical protein
MTYDRKIPAISATINAIRFANVIAIKVGLNAFACVKPDKAIKVRKTPECGSIVNADDAMAATRCIISGSNPICKYGSAKAPKTIPKPPEADPVIADKDKDATDNPIRGCPGILRMKSDITSNAGAVVTTTPKATAAAVAKTGAMEPAAPSFKTTF